MVTKERGIITDDFKGVDFKAALDRSCQRIISGALGNRSSFVEPDGNGPIIIKSNSDRESLGTYAEISKYTGQLDTLGRNLPQLQELGEHFYLDAFYIERRYLRRKIGKLRGDSQIEGGPTDPEKVKKARECNRLAIGLLDDKLLPMERENMEMRIETIKKKISGQKRKPHKSYK
jgi:hypothetical protein